MSRPCFILAVAALALAGCLPADLQEQFGLAKSPAASASVPAGDLAPDVERRYQLVPKLATQSVSANATLRALPVKGAKAVGKTSKGQRVDTLGRMAETGYYLVMLPGGQIGYLHEDFLSATAVAGATPKPAHAKASTAPAATPATAEPVPEPIWDFDPSAWADRGRDNDRDSDSDRGSRSGGGRGGGDSGGGGNSGNAGNAGSAL